MKVRIMRGTCLGGVDNDVFPGDIREIPEFQAKALIAAGRAVEVAEVVIEPIEAEKPKRKKDAR